MKRCPGCETTKPLEEFPPNRAKRDGRQDRCQPCYRSYQSAYRQANRDTLTAYAKAYYRANPERWSENQRVLTAAQIEAKRAYTRAWRAAHPDWVRLLDRASNKVRWALKTGRLVRASECQWCGRGGCKIAGAHWDYERPLDVVWLCYPCHSRWDAADPKLPREAAS